MNVLMYFADFVRSEYSPLCASSLACLRCIDPVKVILRYIVHAGVQFLPHVQKVEQVIGG